MHNFLNSINYNFPQIAAEAGFKFQKIEHNTEVNWKIIGNIEIDDLFKGDYEKLENLIPHLLNAPIGNYLNAGVVDPAFSKYFTLAQLVIQYLLFCKQFLDRNITQMRDILNDNIKEMEKLKKDYKKKSEQLKKTTSNDQYSIIPCTKCVKVFSSQDALNSHSIRKHLDQIPNQDLKNKNIFPSDTTSIEPKECLQCKSNNSKSFLNIGIQTNFIDEKEKNNEEENFLHLIKHQQDILENLQNSDNNKLLNEVKLMQKNLIETFNELNNHKITNIQDKISQFLDESKIDKNANNYMRFAELENLYIQGQNNMLQIIQNLDEKYASTLKKIEETYKSKSFVDTIQVTSSQENKKENDIQSFNEESVSESSDSSDSSDHDEINMENYDKRIPIVKNPQDKKLNKTPEISKNTIEIKTSSPVTNKVSKDDIKKLVKYRMKNIGINPKWKTLSYSQFNFYSNVLTSKREHVRKSNKGYFIICNSLSKKIENSVMAKMRKENLNKKLLEDLVKPTSIPVAAPRLIKPVKEITKKFNDNEDLQPTTSSDVIQNIGDKPIPKKRVLFALKREQSTNIIDDLSD